MSIPSDNFTPPMDPSFRRIYRNPRLFRYGGMQKLTASGSSGFVENTGKDDGNSAKRLRP